MTSISVMGYRDLGTQVGQTLTYTAEGLYERDLLERVYPRGVVETELPEEVIQTPLPFGRYGPSGLWAISNYVYEFDHRRYSENLVDLFLSYRLRRDEADIHYHEIPGFLRSFRVSEDQDRHTVVVGGTELTVLSQQRKEREREKFDIDIDIPAIRRRQARKRKQTIEMADQVIALSNFVKDSFVRGGIDGDKITVVSQAVDPDRYPQKESYNNEIFRALFVGSITLMKGLPYLFDAWESLGWGVDQSAELVLCGSPSGDIKPFLDDISFNNLTMPGWVDPRPYYQEASVFVFPSLTEGFSKATLEAMSTGTPVIVSENSGTPDIMEDGREGFVVPIQDAKALEEKLRYFRANPTEIERMGRNARETAEQYTWDRFVNGVVETIT